MTRLLQWLDNQIRDSRIANVDIGTGEYFAYVKVKEFVAKHFESIASVANICNNQELKCLVCGSEFNREQSNHEE